MAGRNYFSHRVYAHARFHELIALLGKFLQAARYWVSGLDDHCRPFKPAARA
jgi:hypothetical protein